MQIPAGVIIDKMNVRVAAFLSAAFCALGILLFASTTNCYVAGLGQMILGFGSSFAFLLAIKVIASLFPAKKIPVMTSYTISVGVFGGPVIGGPILSYLIKDFSWVCIIKIFAFIGFVLALVIWLIIPNSKQIRKMDGHIFDSMKTILASRQVWVLALYTTMLYAPLSALGDLWGVSFIKKAYGVDSNVAAFANNMLYIGLVVGTPLLAHLAVLLDSYKKPMIIGVGGAAICMAIVLFGNLPLEVFFVLFFMLGCGCGAVLAYPLAVSLFPNSISAAVTGFVNMASMVSGVILMPLIGYIINMSWDGKMENGVKIYDLNDFRLGLIPVLVFLVLGVILSFMVKDRSLKESH
jgi:MFS family permease